MNQALPPVIAIVGIIVGGVAIHTAGQRLLAEQPAAEVEQVTLDPDTEDLARQATEPEAAAEPEALVEPEPPVESPRELKPTQPADGAYERVEPRPPLGELGEAKPPKTAPPPDPNSVKPRRLFNPVATAAGVIEAQGYRLALKGVDPLPISEECTFEGRTWPCGTQARSAFRSWLRTRAVRCAVPETPPAGQITTECTIGKDDPAAWLVASGWAKATADGPYAEASKAAERDRKGMFGPPPRTISIAAPPQPSPLDLPAIEPAPEPVEQPETTPPSAAPPSTNSVFPPAPAPATE